MNAFETSVCNGHLVSIVSDDNPYDPRVEYDNFCTMICWHDGYSLGDKHDFSGTPSFLGNLFDEVSRAVRKRVTLCPVLEAIEAFDTYPFDDYLQEIKDENRKRLMSDDIEFISRYLCEEESVHEAVGEAMLTMLRSLGVVITKLTLYDHGGISISCGSFSCSWDSSSVGFAYVLPDRIKENWSVKSLEQKIDYKDGKPPKSAHERASDLMRAEVEMYNCYISGDTWGFKIESMTEDSLGLVVPYDPYLKGSKLNEVDSCWGYFGLDLCRKEGKFSAESLESPLPLGDQPQAFMCEGLGF